MIKSTDFRKINELGQEHMRKKYNIYRHENVVSDLIIRPLACKIVNILHATRNNGIITFALGQGILFRDILWG